MRTDTHTPADYGANRGVRVKARIIGTLFLAGFLTYGIGSTLATSIAGSADQGRRAVLVVGALVLVNGDAAISGNFIAYNIAMAGLGIGSLFFCAVLLRSGLIPPFLALWGLLGYAFFGAASLLELLGVGGAGLVGAIPGGLFEVAFGIWLIIRGFHSTEMVTSARGLQEQIL